MIINKIPFYFLFRILIVFLRVFLHMGPDNIKCIIFRRSMTFSSILRALVLVLLVFIELFFYLACHAYALPESDYCL